jgi:vesicle-associated membrane protein 7
MSSNNPLTSDSAPTTHYELSSSVQNNNTVPDRGGHTSVDQLNAQLDQVKQITIENIEKVIDRGERIDMLVEGTERLQQSSHHFHRQSRSLARSMLYRKYRCYAIIIVLIVLGIYVLAWMICGNGTLKNCG